MKYNENALFLGIDKGVYTFNFKNYSVKDRVMVCLLILLKKAYIVDSNKFHFVQVMPPRRGKPKKNENT